MKRLNKKIGISTAFLIITLFTQLTAYAQIGPEPKNNARHNRIVGLWDVDVTINHCTLGFEIAHFKALHKYELGGTGQVVPATNPAGLSAHMMIWSHADGNDYQMSIKMFRFDPSGNYIGWMVLTNEISIDEAADEYTGSGFAEVFNTDGVLVAQTCPSFVGTRFTGGL